MAGIKELKDVSSAILNMETLAMDSMDILPGTLSQVEAAAVLTGAQSKGTISTDSRAWKDRGDGHEIEDRFGIGAQEMEFRGSKETNHGDDEGLLTDPRTLETLQEVSAQDAHELVKTKETGDGDVNLMTDPGIPETPGTSYEGILQDALQPDEIKDMSVDKADNNLEEERGSDDEALGLKSSSPQGEFQEDFNAPDEIKDMSVDEADNNLEEERGSDDEALGLKSSSPQGEFQEDFNAPDEIKDVNVDGPEIDLDGLGDGDGGEESLNSEKFVAPFPISRVKRIIKLDKDVRLVTSDAIALVAQATALFVQDLSSASFTVMLRTKRKTIRGPDVVLAAKSTRQFRECLGNDLETLFEESNGDAGNGEDGPVEKDHGPTDESVRTRPQHQKSAKKHQLAAPPGSRPITNFFKA